MKIITSLFVVIFLLASPAFAADVDRDLSAICDASDSCKKACDLKLVDKFNEASPEQQQIIVQCASDISQKFNFKQ
jgi:heterodisulfide reductase subunit A-like polyferredoxin